MMSHAKFLSLALGLIFVAAQSAVALPPPEDIPEEVLRTEIITEARSPIDGKPLTATEYAELKAELEGRSAPPQVSTKIQRLIFLLRLRRLIRTVIPGAPI